MGNLPHLKVPALRSEGNLIKLASHWIEQEASAQLLHFSNQALEIFAQ
jgi:hypothetical protein